MILFYCRWQFWQVCSSSCRRVCTRHSMSWLRSYWMLQEACCRIDKEQRDTSDENLGMDHFFLFAWNWELCDAGSVWLIRFVVEKKKVIQGSRNFLWKSYLGSRANQDGNPTRTSSDRFTTIGGLFDPYDSIRHRKVLFANRIFLAE